MVHANEVLWQGENGGTTWETSHQCDIMKKVIHKEVGAGGRFDFFLDSGGGAPLLKAVKSFVAFEGGGLKVSVIVLL